MDDLVESFLIGLAVVVLGVAVLILAGFAIADGLSTSEGTVVKKYYDDPDLVCSKGCFRTPECWTIVVDSEPWWNKDTCVSESEYDSIKLGDYFKE